MRWGCDGSTVAEERLATGARFREKRGARCGKYPFKLGGWLGMFTMFTSNSWMFTPKNGGHQRFILELCCFFLATQEELGFHVEIFRSANRNQQGWDAVSTEYKPWLWGVGPGLFCEVLFGFHDSWNTKWNCDGSCWAQVQQKSCLNFWPHLSQRLLSSFC